MEGQCTAAQAGSSHLGRSGRSCACAQLQQPAVRSGICCTAGRCQIAADTEDLASLVPGASHIRMLLDMGANHQFQHLQAQCSGKHVLPCLRTNRGLAEFFPPCWSMLWVLVGA